MPKRIRRKRRQLFEKITIELVTPINMRYRTVGDWFYASDDELTIQIADTGNWKYNILVAIHELIEVVLCRDAGVTEKQVDKFDLAHQDDEDPGTHPKAPYGVQHLTAMGIEMILAACMGVKWRTYEEGLDRIYYKIPKRKKPL